MLIRSRQTIAPDPDKRQILPDAEFHPSGEMVVVTSWASNELLVYTSDKDGLQLKQRISGKEAGFHNPHSVIFADSGSRMLVNSYSDNAIFVFEVDGTALEGDLSVAPTPIQRIDTPESLSTKSPHSMSITANGEFLASAYCDAEKGGNKVVVYRMESGKSGYELSIASVLNAEDIDFKNPKGVAFTPCSRSLLITVSDCHELFLYDFDSETGTLNVTPKQVLGNSESNIFVPEEISFTPCEQYCLVSNAANNRLGFYSYDKEEARISGNHPAYELGNHEALFNYPHGIGYAPDGARLVVTDYGYFPNPQVDHSDNFPAKITVFDVEGTPGSSTPSYAGVQVSS